MSNRRDLMKVLAERLDLHLSEDQWSIFEELTKEEGQIVQTSFGPLHVTPNIVSGIRNYPQDFGHYVNNMRSEQEKKALIEYALSETPLSSVGRVYSKALEVGIPVSYFLERGLGPDPGLFLHKYRDYLTPEEAEKAIEILDSKGQMNGYVLEVLSGRFPERAARYLLEVEPDKYDYVDVRGVLKRLVDYDVEVGEDFWDTLYNRHPGLRNDLLSLHPHRLGQDTFNAAIDDPEILPDTLLRILQKRPSAMTPAIADRLMRVDHSSDYEYNRLVTSVVPQDQFERAYLSDNPPSRRVATVFARDGRFPETLFEAAIARGDPELVADSVGVGTPVSIDTHRMLVSSPTVGEPVQRVATRNLAGPPEEIVPYLSELYERNPESYAVELLANENLPPQWVDRIYSDYSDRVVSDRVFEDPMLDRELEHHMGSLSDETIGKLEAAAKVHSSDGLTKPLRLYNEIYRPDSIFDQRITIRRGFGSKKFGLNALRKLRDKIDEEYGGTVAKKALEQAKLHPGDTIKILQGPKGEITSSRIQEFIDSLPGDEWNISTDEWKGVQRHTTDHSKVVQVNLTNQQVQRMKEAGVWDTFRSMHDASYKSYHPVNRATIGWIRYTDSIPETDRMGDEDEGDEQEVETFDPDRFRDWLQYMHDDYHDSWVSFEQGSFEPNHEPGTPEYEAELDDWMDNQSDKYDSFLSDLNPDMVDTEDEARSLLRRYDSLVGTPFLDWFLGDPSSFVKIDYEPAASAGALDAPGIFIDEIQSDFGQSFVKLAARQAAEEGHDPAEAAQLAEEKWPQEHQVKIREILFGDSHPNEVLHEAFQEYMRTKGRIGEPVAIHGLESNTLVSQLDPDRPPPVHSRITYRDAPKRMGWEGSSYGKLSTQGSRTLQGMTTYQDRIRKTEPYLLEALGKMAVSSKDFQDAQLDVDLPSRQPSVIGDADSATHSAIQSPMAGEKDWRDNIISTPQIIKPSSHTLGGIFPKMVYKDHDSGRRFMVKDYRSNVYPDNDGWGEITSRALYDAGQIGHLHQNVFLHHQPVGLGWSRVPHVIVDMDPEIKHTIDEWMSKHWGKRPKVETQEAERLGADAAKIGFMDYLADNYDRHGGNLMFGVRDGSPSILAIDHGLAYSPVRNRSLDPDKPTPYTPGPVLGSFSGVKGLSGFGVDPVQGLSPASEWWDNNKDAIKRVFESHSGTLPEPRRSLTLRGFNARWDELTAFTRNILAGGEPKFRRMGT